jgi:competence protein ComEA
VAVNPIPAVGEELDEVTEVISSMTGSSVSSTSGEENLNRPVTAFLIDPNTAPADSLELLPGVGRVLADRIIEHRTKYPFKSPLDLLSVRGIGTSTYENLRHFIRIDPNRIPGKDQHKKDMK